MSINSDNPFAQLVLSPRNTTPGKMTAEAKEKGEVRRRIEDLQERLELQREWGMDDDTLSSRH